MRARYYDPGAGRFLSVDPVEGDFASPQELSRYTYAANRPPVLVDADGRVVIQILAGIAIFALVYPYVITPFIDVPDLPEPDRHQIELPEGQVLRKPDEAEEVRRLAEKIYHQKVSESQDDPRKQWLWGVCPAKAECKQLYLDERLLLRRDANQEAVEVYREKGIEGIRAKDQELDARRIEGLGGASLYRQDRSVTRSPTTLVATEMKLDMAQSTIPFGLPKARILQK
jgi:hypothetical protein